MLTKQLKRQNVTIVVNSASNTDNGESGVKNEDNNSDISLNISETRKNESPSYESEEDLEYDKVTLENPIAPAPLDNVDAPKNDLNMQ